jgi:NAD(P)-dependent dehydrogenase (short-subunit alcohol dehydrogenase family)
VNAIAPGYIATELTEPLQRDPVRAEQILARIPPAAGDDRRISNDRWSSSPAPHRIT